MLIELIGMIKPKYLAKYVAIGGLTVFGSVLIDIVRGDQILKPEYCCDEELTNEEE